MSSARIIEQAFALARAGRGWEAASALEAALRQHPADGALRMALGQVRWHAGEREAGAALLGEAAAAGHAPARREHARALWALGTLAEAAAAFERVVGGSPRDVDAWDELAQVLASAGDFAGAWKAYERAVRANPGDPTPYLRWVHAAVRAGEVVEAVRAAQLGVAAYPNSRECVENLCLAMAFDDASDEREVLALHRRRGEMARAASRRGTPTFANRRDPERLLRVAFYSTDFRFHACAFFLAGLLSRLDRARIAPFCYSFGEPDQVSQAFAGLGQFRDLRAASDAEIERAARDDGIDVVVDCSGWSAGHRMEALTPRIAPVQATYLGYSNTTGLPDMDYRIVDAVTDPAGAETFASERLLRLPACFVCFAMPEHTPPPAPSAWLASGGRTGGVTFGCFNRLEKVQGRVLACWGELLRRVPGATILLKAQEGSPARVSLLRRFAAAGGDASRVRWTPFEMDPAAHLRAYHGVDVSLDPFPYNGTTTTCESLLMSVPVVALRGGVHRSRVGASILAAAGMGDLVATDESGYVGIAAGLAGDAARLSRLHASTRGQMLGSPVCNATRYAEAFEIVLRGAWRAWCAAG